MSLDLNCAKLLCIFRISRVTFETHVFIQVCQLLALCIDFLSFREIVVSGQITNTMLVSLLKIQMLLSVQEFSMESKTYIFFIIRPSCFALSAIYLRGMSVR